MTFCLVWFKKKVRMSENAALNSLNTLKNSGSFKFFVSPSWDMAATDGVYSTH